MTTLKILFSPSQTGGCLVPQSPEFGSSTAAACALESNNSTACIWVPGTPVPEHWALSVKCSVGSVSYTHLNDFF